LKISYVDKNVVDDLINQIDDKYSKEGPITIMKGKVHDYLSMTINYCKDGKVKILMFDNICKMLDYCQRT
jgi:hypothetical protein